MRRTLGRDVNCDDGSLWLTFDRDPRDAILAVGRVPHSDRDAALLTVPALADARFATFSGNGHAGAAAMGLGW